MKHRNILSRFKISKDAWRNIYGENGKMINFAMLKVNDVMMPKVIKMLLDASVRGKWTW
jgi:hypothetical protein